jgi:hypothetical protein
LGAVRGLADLASSLADQGEDLSCDVPLETPDGLEFGMALRDALCDMGLGARIASKTADGDDV